MVTESTVPGRIFRTAVYHRHVGYPQDFCRLFNEAEFFTDGIHEYDLHIRPENGQNHPRETGAGPQIFAADEAVKATNCEIVKIELPRDTEGGAGHGSLIIFGAEDVSDARRAVEVCLREVDRTMGDVYGSPAGHLEFQYTARASHALNKAFGAPIGKAFGITVGAPAAIGVLLADTAVKAATVDVVGYSSPANGGTSFSNEVILTFTGDSGAVKQAIIAARDVGMQVLKTLEPSVELKSTTTPYIL